MAVRIPYPTDTPWGSQISSFTSQVARTQGIGQRIMDALNSMAHDGAGPFDQLEAELKLAEGDGILLYQTMNVAQQALIGIDVAPLDQGLN